MFMQLYLEELTNNEHAKPFSSNMLRNQIANILIDELGFDDTTKEYQILLEAITFYCENPQVPIMILFESVAIGSYSSFERKIRTVIKEAYTSSRKNLTSMWLFLFGDIQKAPSIRCFTTTIAKYIWSLNLE